MSKFYFTYGVTPTHPFQGGWTEIEAPNRATAAFAFRQFHPDREPGILNCAFVYTEEEFEKTGMAASGNNGYRCRERIVARVSFDREEVRDGA